MNCPTSWTPEKFCSAPHATSTTAASAATGTRMRSVPRTRSAQKLPSSPERERAKPRTSATATAMPTAADTKFCTARPAVCTTWPMVCSPAYDCQLVLVTNDTAVLNDCAGVTAEKPSEPGRTPWSRWSR